MTVFLDLDDALFVAQRMGFHVKDAGLLASALARPTTTVGGADAYPSLPEKAAALLESLAQNHALVDGNKRTAWTLTSLFLWMNGHILAMGADDAFDLVVGVASGHLALDESARSISACIRARP
jgi:death-on-curing protein